jgi:hypothetical protein
MNAALILLACVTLDPLAVHADGGTVRLREASGPFLVTVFTESEPLRVGLIDASILVQDRETGRVILDTTVNLAFQRIPGPSARLLSRATNSHAKNKLLQAATVDLPAPGWWALQVLVCRGGKQAIFSAKLLVRPAAPRLARIWPWLIIPPCAICLFALHQTLRRTRLL